MKVQLFETGLGDRYRVLGQAMKRSDLWLVRHCLSQELALVQKISRPFPGLATVLNGGLAGFPRILDSWVDRGEVYVVIERVEGQELQGLARPFGLGRRLADQMLALRALLKKLGLPGCSGGNLCLTQSGQLRLRWIPTDAERGSRAVPQKAQPASALSWLRSFWKRAC